MSYGELVVPYHLPIQLVFTLILVVANGYVFYKGYSLYSLVKYKGFKYFSFTYLFWAIAFIFLLAQLLFAHVLLIPFPHPLYLVADLLIFYTASVAGYYLLYSLVWKKYESYSVQCSLCKKHHLLHVMAFLVGVAEVYLIYAHGNTRPYIFYLTQIFALSLAMRQAHKLDQAKKKQDKKTFLYAYKFFILFAIGAYVLYFIAGYVVPIFPYTAYVFWALTASLFIAVAFKVRSLTAHHKSK